MGGGGDDSYRPVRSAASVADAKEAVAAKAKEAYEKVVVQKQEEGGVSMLSLLATPPQQSCMWVQVSLVLGRLVALRGRSSMVHQIP